MSDPLSATQSCSRRSDGVQSSPFHCIGRPASRGDISKTTMATRPNARATGRGSPTPPEIGLCHRIAHAIRALAPHI